MITIAVTARRVVAPYGETDPDCHSIWPVSFTAVLAGHIGPALRKDGPIQGERPPPRPVGWYTATILTVGADAPGGP